MTLFVVWASPPLCSSTTPSSQQTTAAHPPGPGLRWHAPSVQTSTSPGAACGRWPGSDLDRRRGLTAIWRDSTNPGTRKAARRATPDAVLPATHRLTRSQLTQPARGALHMQTRTSAHRLAGPASGDEPTQPGGALAGALRARQGAL